ncbi:hypothetical protein ACFL31_02830 [Candidatus Margulisiibacteriota bacterium]
MRVEYRAARSHFRLDFALDQLRQAFAARRINLVFAFAQERRITKTQIRALEAMIDMLVRFDVSHVRVSGQMTLFDYTSDGAVLNINARDLNSRESVLVILRPIFEADVRRDAQRCATVDVQDDEGREQDWQVHQGYYSRLAEGVIARARIEWLPGHDVSIDGV